MTSRSTLIVLLLSVLLTLSYAMNQCRQFRGSHLGRNLIIIYRIKGSVVAFRVSDFSKPRDSHTAAHRVPDSIPTRLPLAATLPSSMWNPIHCHFRRFTSFHSVNMPIPDQLAPFHIVKNCLLDLHKFSNFFICDTALTRYSNRYSQCIHFR